MTIWIKFISLLNQLFCPALLVTTKAVGVDCQPVGAQAHGLSRDQNSIRHPRGGIFAFCPVLSWAAFISFRSQPWRYEEGLVVVIIVIIIFIIIIIIIVPSYAWFKDVGRFRLADCSWSHKFHPSPPVLGALDGFQVGPEQMLGNMVSISGIQIISMNNEMSCR